MAVMEESQLHGVCECMNLHAHGVHELKRER